MIVKDIKEIRLFDNVEFRIEESENKKFIQGYALKFGLESRDLGGFREIIKKGSLDEADLSDVVAVFNHNPNYVLARKNTEVDTLELTIDDTGLFYRFEVDEEISYIKDLYRNIQKKNISKSSFAFKIAEGGDDWALIDGTYIRTISKFKGIYDVSPVVSPAYNDTDSSVRTFNEFKETVKENQTVELNNLNELKLRLLCI